MSETKDSYEAARNEFVSRYSPANRLIAMGSFDAGRAYSDKQHKSLIDSLTICCQQNEESIAELEAEIAKLKSGDRAIFIQKQANLIQSQDAIISKMEEALESYNGGGYYSYPEAAQEALTALREFREAGK